MKIGFHGSCTIPWGRCKANREYALSLGLPWWGRTERGVLAVVGGGRSVLAHSDELRNWPNDVWAINGAVQWCRQNDIEATLFSVDPDPELADFLEGVRDALLCSFCDPLVFDKARALGVNVTLCESSLTDRDFEAGNRETPSGITTATAALVLGPAMGFSRVVFFGCESSYPGGQTHTYRDQLDPQWFRVRANGELFVTKAEFLLQAIMLADLIPSLPGLYAEKSGGLLGALCENPEWDIEAVSEAMYAGLSGSKEGVEVCQSPW